MRICIHDNWSDTRPKKLTNKEQEEEDLESRDGKEEMKVCTVATDDERAEIDSREYGEGQSRQSSSWSLTMSFEAPSP